MPGWPSRPRSCSAFFMTCSVSSRIWTDRRGSASVVRCQRFRLGNRRFMQCNPANRTWAIGFAPRNEDSQLLFVRTRCPAELFNSHSPTLAQGWARRQLLGDDGCFTFTRSSSCNLVKSSTKSFFARRFACPSSQCWPCLWQVSRSLSPPPRGGMPEVEAWAIRVIQKSALAHWELQQAHLILGLARVVRQTLQKQIAR